MRITFAILASLIASIQAAAAATPAASPVQIEARAGTSACASAASASASYVKANPSSQLIEIPAQLAYDCLKSVPLNKNPALVLIKALKPYIQLHSTVDYLRNPPTGYLWDAVDIPRLLDAIETKLLSKDTYASEYDFQLDISTAVLAARDGHFAWYGDAMTVFEWLRPLTYNVVCVSVDGKSVPQVYAAADVLSVGTSSIAAVETISGSPIKSINGLDVTTFFLADGNVNAAQDPDASWNTRFFHISDYVQKGTYGSFNQPVLYPGPTTDIVYQNGTKVTLNNLALVASNLTGISTGDDFYKKFCVGQTYSPNEKRSVSSLARRQSSSGSGLWPDPESTDNAGVVSGYYLDDSDVAVLVVSSFSPGKGTVSDLVSFQDTVSNFFADAVEKGKKKLVIDLQGNGGGALDLAIDLVAQLFPTVAPNSKDNMRASVGMYGIITAASNAAEQANSLDAESDVEVDYTVVPFAYQEIMTPDVKNFNRLSDFYGPAHVGTGFFTNFFQGNYTNDSPSQYGLPGIVITGTNNRTHFQQPFDAANIIMLSDGFCASACTIFSEHMKQQGVQAIALGGRPQTGPMQNVGGTKGSQVFESDNIEIMLELYSNTTYNTALKQAEGTVWEDFNAVPIDRSGGSVGVNGRNQFRIGDTTQTPLQFVYEAADCRIYQTPEMAASPTPIWERVADVAFNNRTDSVITSEYCVQDSTKHGTSLSGGLKAGEIGPQTPPSTAKSKTTGLLINGSQIVNGLASGQINGNSAVDPSIAASDGLGDSSANHADVLAAVDTMVGICKEYNGTEWFVEMLCGALTKQNGGS